MDTRQDFVAFDRKVNLSQFEGEQDEISLYSLIRAWAANGHPPEPEAPGEQPAEQLPPSDPKPTEPMEWSPTCFSSAYVQNQTPDHLDPQTIAASYKHAWKVCRQHYVQFKARQDRRHAKRRSALLAVALEAQAARQTKGSQPLQPAALRTPAVPPPPVMPVSAAPACEAGNHSAPVLNVPMPITRYYISLQDSNGALLPQASTCAPATAPQLNRPQLVTPEAHSAAPGVPPAVAVSIAPQVPPVVPPAQIPQPAVPQPQVPHPQIPPPAVPPLQMLPAVPPPHQAVVPPVPPAIPPAVPLPLPTGVPPPVPPAINGSDPAWQHPGHIGAGDDRGPGMPALKVPAALPSAGAPHNVAAVPLPPAMDLPAEAVPLPINGAQAGTGNVAAAMAADAVQMVHPVAAPVGGPVGGGAAHEAMVPDDRADCAYRGEATMAMDGASPSTPRAAHVQPVAVSASPHTPVHLAGAKDGSGAGTSMQSPGMSPGILIDTMRPNLSTPADAYVLSSVQSGRTDALTEGRPSSAAHRLNFDSPAGNQIGMNTPGFPMNMDI